MSKNEEKKKDDKGIPFENENVSNNPNLSPKGDDHDKKVKQKENYVEPYNKKKYDQDPKNNK
ncbi:hypothetical protein [Owenweeksia hongkongensis]|uniref:Uncharacterized protein n=1 Tax=Owenweeksia hongkongensis (strain DSM 17368 / CIP 108786 / JCM 12287 / NRRL B-23963 / UST20020801) TaxID=926562 RepID=G8R4M6_OWEHD|nr:hypothetical protein [Owenweeksia hongkongensis]AEV32115.1 hypothetical protein Oweho_1109 [Owenweeksia hongkongensis DSM 17368]